MRFTIAAFALLAAVPASAQTRRIDVPQDRGPQRVEQLVREIPVGAASGWHTHPGVEMGYVLAGETEMRLADGTALRLRAGDFFTIPRGRVHDGVNVGSETLRLLVTYVIDRDAPARADAPPPRP